MLYPLRGGISPTGGVYCSGGMGGMGGGLDLHVFGRTIFIE